jgi:hypothetical protein
VLHCRGRLGKEHASLLRGFAPTSKKHIDLRA